jgi:hypothetical protein
VNYVQKGGIFVHGFPTRRFNAYLRLSGPSSLRFLYNNGQFPAAESGPGRAGAGPGERRAVLGVTPERRYCDAQRSFTPAKSGLARIFFENIIHPGRLKKKRENLCGKKPPCSWGGLLIPAKRRLMSSISILVIPTASYNPVNPDSFI